MITITVALASMIAASAPLAGCRPEAPPAPQEGVETSALPKIRVKEKAKKMLFTFVKAGDTFETVDAVEKVPAARRGWVRVVDLRMKPQRRQDHELVYVADLRKLERGGYPYVVMSRRAFETAAINRLREGVTDPPAPPQGGDRPGQGTGGVILYATSWCSACRSARAFLQQQGIPFVEKDIEQDSAGAAELLSKARQAGISASGVPVLDINGTLVQGFDPDRITSLLGGKRP